MLSLVRARREDREVRDRALDVMEFLGIAALAETDATSLAYGQQRAVELARALASDPELVLLDEPAAGLNIRETRDLAAIARVRAPASPSSSSARHVARHGHVRRVLVLSYGEKIADADPRSVQGDPNVVKVYLGDSEC
jgi:ABC-type branched-subunit amino acid transport system ATPase component